MFPPLSVKVISTPERSCGPRKVFLLKTTKETAVLYREGQPKKRFSAGKIIYVQKRSERAHFLVWPARTTLEGGGSGRGANVYVHLRLRVRTPPCASVSFCWFLCFGAQDATHANRRAVRGCIGKSCEFRGWPRFAISSRFFPMRILRFMALGER